MADLTPRQQMMLFQAKLRELNESDGFDFDAASRLLDEIMQTIAMQRDEKTSVGVDSHALPRRVTDREEDN